MAGNGPRIGPAGVVVLSFGQQLVGIQPRGCSGRSCLLVAHQQLHHLIHVVVAVVREDLGIVFARLAHHHIAEMHLADAVARGEPVAHHDRVFAQLAGDAAVPGHAVGRGVHRFDQPFPVREAVQDLGRATAHRRRRIVGMHRHHHIVLFRHRDHFLEEVGHVLPGIVIVLGGAVCREGRQILHPVILEFGHAGAAAARHLLVSVRGAMVVEIPFQHGDAQLAHIDDGLLDLGDFLVAARQAAHDLVHVGIDAAIVRPADHHDADMHAVLLERVDARLNVIHAPGLFRHGLGIDPVDPQLLDGDGLFFAQQVVHVGCELGCIGTFLRLADVLVGMGLGGIRTLGPGGGRRPHRPAAPMSAVVPAR